MPEDIAPTMTDGVVTDSANRLEVNWATARRYSKTILDGNLRRILELPTVAEIKG